MNTSIAVTGALANDYVDIERYVHPLEDDSPTEARRWARAHRADKEKTLLGIAQSKSLTPVVLVAPSGTGKTTEFRRLAQRLREMGHPAVYAEAIGILGRPEMDMETTERAAFDMLLESKMQGILLIDALDELYLHRNNLEQLFRRLEKEISFSARPTKLIFSAHNEAWTPSTCRELRRLLRRVTVDDAKLVSFEPLDTAAIRALAASCHVENVDRFMEAFENDEIINLIDLKPEDVKMLARLHSRRGRLSKWSEILQEYVDASFVATSGDRQHRQRLSIEAGRRGLQRSAAASMLMKLPHISTSSVQVATGAISSRSLFADWSPSELMEFFANPLFVHKGNEGEAVQLPQGPLSHFLVARWFAERVRLGLRPETLRDMLILRRPGDGRPQIPLVYRSMVGWLTSGVPEFRRYIGVEFPAILLYEGDPDRLSDAEIKDALRGLCDSAPSTCLATPATLRRLARPGLEPYVKSLIDAYDKNSAVLHLLKLVEHGRYRTCAATALRLAASADSLISLCAIAAFAAAAPDERQKLAAFTSNTDPYVRIVLTRSLLPGLLTGSDLVSFVLESSPHELRVGLEEVAQELPTDDLDALLVELAPILSRSTVDNKTQSALAAALPVSRARLERGNGNEGLIIDILASAERLRYANRSAFVHHSDQEVAKINRLLGQRSDVRHDLWLRRLDVANMADETFQVLMTPVFGEADVNDLAWLWQYMQSHSSDSAAGARLVLERIWSRVSQPDRVATLARIELVDLKSKLEALSQQEAEIESKRRVQEDSQAEKEADNRSQNELALVTRRAGIESGEDLESLIWGWELLEGPHGDESRLNPSQLRRHVGDDYVEVFLRGLRACWRKMEIPILTPGEGKKLRYLLALTGVTLSARADEDFTLLSLADAQRAARLALYELNSFPFWYRDLARAQPSAVCEALQQALALEWSHASDVHGVLRFAPSADPEISSIVRSIVLEFLKTAPPENSQTVQYAVDAILTSTEDIASVRSLARREVGRAGDVSPDPNWLRMWAHVEPEAAANWFDSQMVNGKDLAVPLLLKTASLLEQDLNERFGRTAATLLMAPKSLGHWIRLLLRVLDLRDDVVYKQVYSPGDRDYAKDLRERCMARLSSDPTPIARSVLLELAADPQLTAFVPAFLGLLEQQETAAVEASVLSWTEEDVLRVERRDEKLPRTLEELFCIVRDHLVQVHELVANDDFSYRGLFKGRSRNKRNREAPTKEREIQLWVASCLRQRARGLYSVIRENVVDDDKEVDISAFSPGNGHVPIEIKPLGPYSVTALCEILQTQLLGQYMLPPDRLSASSY